MFELEKILVQENSVSSFNSNLNSKIDTSYMTMTMNAIAEYKEELRDGTKNFYTSLLESDSRIESITEAFSDFFKKIAELIKKFLKFIQRMFDKFISHLNGLVKSEKYIRKHKDTFKRFSSENEFSYTGYEYTIVPGIPRSDFLWTEDSYNFISETDISKAIKNYKEKFTDELENRYEDKLRAFVIGKEGTILSEDFSEELFAIFRNGDTSEYEFDVTKSVVDKAYESFDNYDKLTKSTKNEKDNLDKLYRAKKNEIESFDKTFKEADYEKFVKTYIDPNATNVTTATLTKDDISNISLIMKAKADEVSKAMDIHGLAFAAKLDAIKARYVQDKTILYKVLYKLGIRESGMSIDIDEVDYSTFNEESINLMENISNIELGYGETIVTTESGDVVYLEGDYDLLDFANPSEELINLCTEKGVLQIADGEENAFSSEIFPDDIAYKVGIEDTPNPNNISYDIFVATEALKDAELYAYIQETILEASGETNPYAYTLIHENLADSIKNGLNKIWNFIVTMWNKFSQTMEELFKNDVKYLEKYHDIITKKEFLIGDVECWSYFDNNHGVSLAISPKFSIGTTLPDMEKDADSKAEYLAEANKFLSTIGSNEKIEKLGDFQDAVLKQLREPYTTYTSKQLHENSENMYKFCHDYKSQYKKSSKDLLDKIDKKSKEYSNAIDKIGATIKESTLFMEEDGEKQGGVKFSDTKNSSSDKDGAATNAYSRVNKDDEKEFNKTVEDNKQTAKSIADDESSNAEEKKKELNKMKEYATEFLNYASAILGAKISFGEEAYKDYMKIIRAHVRSYAKNENKKSDTKNVTAPENTDTKKNTDKKEEKVERQAAED